MDLAIYRTQYGTAAPTRRLVTPSHDWLIGLQILRDTIRTEALRAELVSVDARIGQQLLQRLPSDAAAAIVRNLDAKSLLKHTPVTIAIDDEGKPQVIDNESHYVWATYRKYLRVAAHVVYPPLWRTALLTEPKRSSIENPWGLQ